MAENKRVTGVIILLVGGISPRLQLVGGPPCMGYVRSQEPLLLLRMLLERLERRPPVRGRGERGERAEAIARAMGKPRDT